MAPVLEVKRTKVITPAKKETKVVKFAEGRYVMVKNSLADKFADYGNDAGDVPAPGDYGKIMKIADGKMAIEFARPFEQGHSCDGATNARRGRYFTKGVPTDEVDTTGWLLLVK